ncbi:MAG: hypothetical protein JNL64_12550 [Blastocatellia bacterium]|nr:hypothetical protein [Blastocatellia bacterium]
MKRLFVSVILGILFPIVYTIIAGTLTDVFPGRFSQEMFVFDKPMPGPILAPTLFPFYFESWLASNRYFGWSGRLDTFWYRTTLLMIPFALYSAIAYGLLRLIGYPKAKTVAGIQEPPPPPASEDI